MPWEVHLPVHCMGLIDHLRQWAKELNVSDPLERAAFSLNKKDPDVNLCAKV